MSVVVALAAVLAAGLVGCGDDDGEDATVPLSDESLDEADSEALDEEINAALVSLGVSDACVAGTG